MKSFKSILALTFILVLRLSCVPVPVPAQTGDYIGNMLVITGASCEEELDEQEIERFSGFLSHPLRLNGSGKSRLVSSGQPGRVPQPFGRCQVFLGTRFGRRI